MARQAAIPDIQLCLPAVHRRPSEATPELLSHLADAPGDHRRSVLETFREVAKGATISVGRAP